MRDFVLLRYVLIIAASYLVITQHGAKAVTWATGSLIAAAIASNVVLGRISPTKLNAWKIAGGIVVVDTVWISVAMALVGKVSAEFFFLYFFILFFAALAENLLLMLVGVIAASAAYLWVLAHLHPGSVWEQEHLLQITFLFSAALFYGVLVSRTRVQRRHAEMIEAADQARTELLATVAHDIGGPAHVITVGVEAIQDTIEGQAGTTSSLFQSVAQNSRYLKQLVQHFMEYARARSGRYPLNPTELSVNAVVERVVAQHEIDAKARDISLTLALGPVPRTVMDELALVRILDNLIGNALRYSEPGAAVSIETALDDDFIRIRVGDSGPGIGAEQRDRLGQAFTDAPRTHGGAGLGLFIVRSLVEAHGGSVAVDSEPGKGAGFTIRLPLTAPPPPDFARPALA